LDTRLFRWGRAALIPLAVSGALLVACSDDEDADTAAEATTEAVATEAAATEAAAGTVEVTAIDYGYEGLPESVPAGTVLTLNNTSTVELHEIVAILLPEGEDRPVDVLLALPEEELMALMGSGEPALVALAAPGSNETVYAVGDGALTQAGRYAIVCFIPTGADPDAYLNAPPGDGPPQVEGGPPHFVAGMWTELTVE
jgi:hypothetical protein